MTAPGPMLRRTLLLAAAAAPLVPAVARAAEAAGAVEEARGTVTAERAAQRRALVPRSDVFVGDTVATASESRAALQLGQTTSLRLGARARVRIDRFLVNQGGVLTLEDGPILLDKTGGDAAHPVQVQGGFGLITVRGTRIFAGPSNGVFAIFVVHGVIDVTAGGQRFALQTGEGTNIAAPGGPASPPVKWGEARVRAALASVT